MKKNNNVLLFAIFQLVVGILLLINPIDFTKVIIIILGVFLLLWGLILTIKYFVIPVELISSEKYLFKGALGIIFGIIFTFNVNLVIQLFPLLATVFGIIILINGLDKLQNGVNLIRIKHHEWIYIMINAIISIIFALIIIFNPFSTIEVLWSFTGICLIVDAIIDIIFFFIVNKKQNQIENKDEIIL